MLLMVHGRGDRPRIPGGPFSCVATPVRIIMPRAPDPLGSGFTWLSVRAAEGRTDELSRQLVDRADQLAALLDNVTTTRPTLGQPIVTGFSQGGMLAFALAVRHPRRMAVALPLAGWLPRPLWPASAQGLPPIRAVHGVDDVTIPLPPTRDAVDELRRLGAAVELVEFAGVAHVMSAEMNTLFEQWLEQALGEQAPTLALRPDDTLVEIACAALAPACAPAADPSPNAQST
jgi:phospholipase/carboxylesterase